MAGTGVLPAPPAGRMAAYTPGGPGYDPFAVIHLDGWSSIFRLMVNVLDHQLDYAREARAVLVDMREDMTPARFDPMALQMLGEVRYKRLQDRFERSWECVGCYTDVAPGKRYAPTNDAAVVCAPCCKGYPEYSRRMVARPAAAATGE